MAEYQISAVLRLKDLMSAKLNAAKQAVAGLGKSAAASTRAATANVKSAVSAIGKSATSMANLRVNLNAGDLARIERLKSTLESAGQHVSKPLNIRANDQATSRLQKIKSELQSLVSKPWQIAVNVKDNAKNMLSNAKGKISDGISTGAAMAGATAMGLGAVGGMTYGVADAFKSQMAFEKQMSAVKAIYSGSFEGKELDSVMKTLTEAAEHAGATTKFTAKEAGEALYYFGMAGWTPERAAAGLMPTLNLAAAGNTDLGTTSDILSDSMTAFQLKAGEYITNSQGKKVEASKHYADLMGALVTHANTDISGLGETLKYAAPVVGAMYSNQSAEAKLLGAQDMMMVAGLMANAGIKNSQAGTSARALFARLGAQNRNANFARQFLNVDFVDEQTGEVRRTKDFFSDLRSRFQQGMNVDDLIAFGEELEGTKLHADTRRKLEASLKSAQEHGGKLSGSEMLKMAAMLSGQEAMSGLLAVLTASEEDWNKINDALDKAEGSVEKMSKIQLDNLAGDVTILGSAWDAFSRNLVKGDASAGLREFTQAITATLSKANELFKDGIDIGDFGEIIVDVIAKLKAKFLELDGIGSLLAGGALAFGLKKILSLGLKVKDTFSALTKVRTAGDIGNLIRGGAAQAGGLQSVGAMNINAGTVNIRAGVVNLSGAVKGLGGAASAGARGGVVNAGGKLSAVQIAEQKARLSATAAARAQSKSDAALAAAWAKPGDAKLMAQYRQADLRATQAAARASLLSAQAANLRASEERAAAYYAKRESVLLQQRQAAELSAVNQNISSQLAAQRRERLGGVAGAGALAAVFGVMDVAATRSNSNYNLNEAQKNLDYEKNQLKILRDQGANVDQINAQLETIRQAEANVQAVTETNAINERRSGAGAAGMVAGTAIGAYLGSFVPILGNMLGGIIGGYVGQWAGEKAADFTSPFQSPQQKQEAILRHYSEGITRHNNDSKITAEERQQIILEKEQRRQESELKKYSTSITRHNEDSSLTAAQREQRRIDEDNQRREQYKDNQTRISAGKGPDYDRQNAFGGTTLSDFNDTDWTDQRGAGMRTVDEYSADIQKKREDFASGVAKNQSALSRIDAIVREGQERQQWYNKKFFGGLESEQKFNYNPLASFKVSDLPKSNQPAAQTETASVSDFRKLEEQTASATEEIKPATEKTETSSATEQIKTNDYTSLATTGSKSTGYENRGVIKTATAETEKISPAEKIVAQEKPGDYSSVSATGNKTTGLENRGVMQNATTETTAAIENLREMLSSFSLEDLFFGKAAASSLHEESDEQNFRDLKGYERQFKHQILTSPKKSPAKSKMLKAPSTALKVQSARRSTKFQIRSAIPSTVRKLR